MILRPIRDVFAQRYNVDRNIHATMDRKPMKKIYKIKVNDKPRQNKSGAYALFVIQMGLNALWTYLFFGLQMI